MRKTITMTVVLALLVGLLSGCGSKPTSNGSSQSADSNSGSSNTEVKLLKTSMPTSWDETHGYTQAIIAMNKYLDEVSGGTLQLDIYAGGQLGDETAVFECLQLGTVDCAVFNSASLSNFTHCLEAFDLPYLWVDETGYADEELHNNVVSSDFAKDYLNQVYEQTSVRAVGFLYNAARDFFLNKPLNSMSDASGIKLRSMTAQMHLDTSAVASGATNNWKKCNPTFRRVGWQTKNKPLEIMVDGHTRLLLPLYTDQFAASIMAYSDDDGKTWEYRNVISAMGDIQAATVQKEDGLLQKCRALWLSGVP